MFHLDLAAILQGCKRRVGPLLYAIPRQLQGAECEAGRAGRDGQPSQAWMVYGLQDVVRLSQMVADSGLSEEMKALHEKLNADMARIWEIRKKSNISASDRR